MITEMDRLLLRVDTLTRGNTYLQEKLQQVQNEKDARISQLEEVVKKQGHELLKLRELVERVAGENAKLAKENKKLYSALGKHMNENTPSGALPPYLKDELEVLFPPEKKDNATEDEEKTAPLPNHRNGRPKPDKTETHKIRRCPRCNGKLTPLKTKRRRRVIHIVLPEAEETEHVSEGGYCPDCKERFYAPVPDTLPNSKYSLDIAIFIVMMLVIYNGTQRKIASLLGKFGVSISPASVNNVYHNVRKYLGERKYLEFEKELKKSMVTNADETSNRHRGKTGWIWLVANAKTVFIRIEDKRNSKIAKKLPLGKYTICDGYRAYDKAAEIIQRSWAKISQRARNPKYCFDEEWEIEQYKTFVADLFKIFHGAKHTKDRGVEMQKIYDKQLKELLVKSKKEEKNLIRLMNYICKYEGEWFTFLLRKGIAPTNNFAEQQLRDIVIKRKISQHTWSEGGKRSLEVFYSIAKTCKLRDEDFADVIRTEVDANLTEMRKS